MKHLTKDYFKKLDFIPVLLKYFALSPDNRVTCPGIGKGVYLTYYQDDKGAFHRVTDLGDGGEPIEVTMSEISVQTILAIISHLKYLPATMEGYGFENMERQVSALSTAYTCFGGI